MGLIVSACPCYLLSKECVDYSGSLSISRASGFTCSMSAHSRAICLNDAVDATSTVDSESSTMLTRIAVQSATDRMRTVLTRQPSFQLFLGRTDAISCRPKGCPPPTQARSCVNGGFPGAAWRLVPGAVWLCIAIALMITMLWRIPTVIAARLRIIHQSVVVHV